jgi:hypothetical protein
LILEFENCGEEKKNYSEVARESYREYFADNLNQAQADVLTLITKDRNITPIIIARTLKLDTDLVIDIIDDFIDRNIIKSIPSKINAEPVYEVLKPASELPGKNSKVTTLVIRYSYEGPEDSKNRPFCAKLIDLSKRKTWSRSDIESISERVGYSVWDRRGGWYTQPNGEHREYCRHRWTSKLMKKKDE